MLLLGIPVERIRLLGDSWSDGGLWDDIAWLALRIWEPADDDERRLRWHHLVMAVGNFKRQGGRRLRPAHIASAPAIGSASRRDQIRIPGGPVVACEDLASWKELERSLHGAATPTTTTLLSALWPERHHVLDWRVLAAVAGLDAVDGSNLGLVEPRSRRSILPTLDTYCQVRKLLIRLADDADLPVSTVERALYLISRGVRDEGMTWTEYGSALRSVHDRRETPDVDGTPDDEQEIPLSAP
jgi:hypothetical protein